MLLIADLPARLLRNAMAPAFRAGALPFTAARSVRPGVSIAAVCMNRQSTLKRALAAWRKVKHVDEIVVVDWGSQPPLQPIIASANDPRIRLVRVNGEPEWVLSRAYNIAMRVASRSNIIRTDCDYKIHPDFVSVHRLRTPGVKNHSFFAGNYLLARNPNEVHLNGAVYIQRADFFRVGGYDERIQTYGWDDEDLYSRLDKSGVRRKNVSYDHISHIKHSDGARAQKSVGFVQVEIDLNRLLLEGLHDPWTLAHMQKSQWRVATGSNGVRALKATKRPRSLKEMSPPDLLAKSWKLAVEQRLAADYAVPWDIMSTMSVDNKRKLLERLNRRAVGRPPGRRPRILFAHVMHGLGNRLRALGSAMSFAHATGRELVVIWETDRHISASFTDLFEPTLVLMPRMKLKWPFKNAYKWDKSWLQVDVVNYMDMEGSGAEKDKLIVNNPSKHLYFKSAYVINADSKLTNWEKDNANLRTLRPVPYVAERLAALEKQGLGTMVGVHIRDRTLERDIKDVNYESEYGAKASEEMEYWRKKSSHRTFILKMRHMLAEKPGIEFYVATDTYAILRRLRKEFPGRILTTERSCDGRDGHCIQYALIDILALSKTTKILGSNWSSFTEAAERFGEKKALLAGKDFGASRFVPATAPVTAPANAPPSIPVV